MARIDKVRMARRIARSYFLLAIVVSFAHLIVAGRKGGLDAQAYLVPFMVDGIALMGLLLRGEEFATRTRRIGFRTQIGASLLSLAGNVYAAHNAGTAVLGIAVVVLFIFAEWLTDARQIQSAAAEAAQLAAEAAAAKKAASQKKAQATRRRNARTRKVTEEALEALLAG